MPSCARVVRSRDAELRRSLILGAIVVIAAILAFPMRGTIYNAVVIPAAFIGWQLGLYVSRPATDCLVVVDCCDYFLLAGIQYPPNAKTSSPGGTETPAKARPGGGSVNLAG